MDRIEEAVRYLELRIALAGEGWSDRGDMEGGSFAASMGLPGGASVEIVSDGTATLSKANGAKLGSGNLLDDRFYASFMHNCDAMIARGFGQGAVEIAEFADAIIEAAAAETEHALLGSVTRSGQPAPDVVDLFVVASKKEVKAAADSVDPKLRAGYFAWRGFATREPFRSLNEWNDWESLVRWHGRVARQARTEEPLPSANGYWTRIEDQCGAVEAARSIGMIEGQLGGFSGERQLYALRMVGFATGVKPMSIVAVAVFEDGELVSVIKHADRAKRPRERIAEDISTVIAVVDKSAKDRWDDEVKFGLG